MSSLPNTANNSISNAWREGSALQRNAGTIGRCHFAQNININARKCCLRYARINLPMNNAVGIILSFSGALKRCFAVLRIWICIRRILMSFGLPDPHPDPFVISIWLILI
jgi:hypothetical protein